MDRQLRDQINAVIISITQYQEHLDSLVEHRGNTLTEATT